MYFRCSLLPLVGVSLYASQALAEFVPKVAGRVEVLLFENACIADTSEKCRSSADAYDPLDQVIREDGRLATRGRIDVEAVDIDALLEFGAVGRLEFDASTKAITDTDGHLFFKSDWGTLRVGTDIDADQGGFDTDFHKEGPLRVQREVTAPKPIHTLDNDAYEEVSLVYTTPSWSGLTFAIESDRRARGAASVRAKNSARGVDYSLGLAIDTAGTLGGTLRLDRDALSLALYGGGDRDGELYLGGGAGVALGALRFTGEAGYITSDRDDRTGGAREVQLVAGVGYQAFRTVEASGSVQWFSTRRRESMAHADYSLEGVKAAARLRVDF